MNKEMLELADIVGLLIFITLVIGMTYIAYRATKFEYKINGEYIVLITYLLGSLPIKRKVRIDSIVDARIISPKQAISAFLKGKRWALLYGNPFHKMVLIERNSGIFSTVFISPADPEVFLEMLTKAREK